MREDPEKEAILKTFSEVEAEDLVQEERDRKAAARKSKMETDLIAEDADLQEKKAVGFSVNFFSLFGPFCPKTVSLVRAVIVSVSLSFPIRQAAWLP